MTATIVVLLIGGVMLALAWAFQRSLIYFPFGSAGAPADAGLDATELISFETDDGIQLGGWFVASRTSPSRGTVIVFNGNAGNRAFRAELARALREHGMAVLLFDYRGYGGNPGRPTEDGLARDARAARAFLETRADVDQRHVVYFGESLGAAVAVRLAVERPPAALVLRSPFTSLAEVGRLHYPVLPVEWLLRDRFDSLSRMPEVRCPVVVIAGDRDRVVPIGQSRRIYAAVSGSRSLVVVEGADHNDGRLVHGPQVVQSTVELVR